MTTDEQDIRDHIDPEHRLGTDRPIPRTRADYVRYTFFGVLGALAIVGVLYLSGVNNVLLYRSTPENAIQHPVPVAVSEAELTVPLTMHLFYSDGFFGTERTPESVQKTVENAQAIWNQAAIYLSLEAIHEYEMSDDDLSVLQYRPGEFVQMVDAYNPETINVFFLSNLRGINGISYGGLRAVAIADKTTVLDYRALAHEIGHQLGLNHLLDDDVHLMSEGSDSVRLTDDEIVIARQEATQFNGYAQ